MMKRYFAAAGAICFLTAVPATAQTTAEHNKRVEISKGHKVTIEGCVAAGEKSGTFVLGTVKEVVAVNVEMLRKRIYWLNSTRQIKGHVGHMVRIDGTVTDLERSEIEINLGAGPSGGAVAKIEGPGGSTVKTPVANVGLGPAGAQPQGEADVKSTLVKIKVDKVNRIAGTCP